MDTFPEDFNIKTFEIKAAAIKMKEEYEQKEMIKNFRLELYKMFSEFMKNYSMYTQNTIKFKFYGKMTLQSKKVILGEIIERFGSVFVNSSGYSNSSLSEIKNVHNIHTDHEEYIIKFKID